MHHQMLSLTVTAFLLIGILIEQFALQLANLALQARHHESHARIKFLSEYCKKTKRSEKG